MKRTIAYIGLGSLGYHLANTLIDKGYPVLVNDIKPELADGLLEKGATWVATAFEAAQLADVVITCLPSSAVIDTVVAGPGGIFEAMTPGKTWMDNSTNDFDAVKRLAELGKVKGIDCLETPVTGGVHLAASGEITILCGAEQSVYEANKPILEAMGSPVIYMGEVGSASIIKVITNMLAFIHLVASGEAMMLAKQAGLDLTKAYQAILNSSGNSFVHETETQLFLNGSYNVMFNMDLVLKDLGFVHRIAQEYGVPMDLAGVTQQTYVRARAQYGGDAESPMVVKLLEDALGTDLRAPGFPAILEA